MTRKVKAFWLQIHWGKYSEVRIYTGPDLPTVMALIEASQRGRLKYNPNGPRITRIASLAPLPSDALFKMFIDECLALESNTGTENLDRAPARVPSP